MQDQSESSRIGRGDYRFGLMHMCWRDLAFFHWPKVSREASQAPRANPAPKFGPLGAA